MFLEDVYGRNAKLANADWTKLVVNSAAWILEPEPLRKKIFEAAGISMKN